MAHYRCLMYVVPIVAISMLLAALMIYPPFMWKDFIKSWYLPKQPFCSGCKILDVGSGSGCWATHLEHVFPKLHVDVADVTVRWDKGTMCRLPVIFQSPLLAFAMNSSYDGVMFIFVLHHCADMHQQSALIEEAVRVIHSNGFILFVEDLLVHPSDWIQTSKHANLDVFHGISDWIRLFSQHGMHLQEFGLLPSWYTLGQSYRPSQGWMLFSKQQPSFKPHTTGSSLQGHSHSGSWRYLFFAMIVLVLIVCALMQCFSVALPQQLLSLCKIYYLAGFGLCVLIYEIITKVHATPTGHNA